MKTAAVATVLLCTAIVAADDKPVEESVKVTVIGTLRTGVVAIGAETTGVTITSNRITWELDFGNNAELRRTAESLNGRKVLVEGTLERRAGVEVKERWIVKVAGLKAAGKKSAMIRYSVQESLCQRRRLTLPLPQKEGGGQSASALPMLAKARLKLKIYVLHETKHALIG